MDSLRENDEKDNESNEPKDSVTNLKEDDLFFKKNSVPTPQSLINEKNKIEASKNEAQVRKEKLLKLGNIAGLAYCTFTLIFICVFCSQKRNSMYHSYFLSHILVLWIILLLLC